MLVIPTLRRAEGVPENLCNARSALCSSIIRIGFLVGSRFCAWLTRRSCFPFLCWLNGEVYILFLDLKTCCVKGTEGAG